jgi:hypothetical protein
LNGAAPGGAYSVPVTLAFPKQASDHNRFAIVDIDSDRRYRQHRHNRER